MRIKVKKTEKGLVIFRNPTATLLAIKKGTVSENDLRSGIFYFTSEDMLETAVSRYEDGDDADKQCAGTLTLEHINAQWEGRSDYQMPHYEISTYSGFKALLDGNGIAFETDDIASDAVLRKKAAECGITVI